MGYMEPAVHCPQKAVKLNHSLTPSLIHGRYHTFTQSCVHNLFSFYKNLLLKIFFLAMVTLVLSEICPWILSWPIDEPDSKVLGANMGPTWVLSTSGGPHVGHINLAIWVGTQPSGSLGSLQFQVTKIKEWPVHKTWMNHNHISVGHCKDLSSVLTYFLLQCSPSIWPTRAFLESIW